MLRYPSFPRPQALAGPLAHVEEKFVIDRSGMKPSPTVESHRDDNLFVCRTTTKSMVILGTVYEADTAKDDGQE